MKLNEFRDDFKLRGELSQDDMKETWVEINKFKLESFKKFISGGSDEERVL